MSLLDRIDPALGATLAEHGLAIEDAQQRALLALAGLDEQLPPGDLDAATLYISRLTDAAREVDGLVKAATRLELYLYGQANARFAEAFGRKEVPTTAR